MASENDDGKSFKLRNDEGDDFDSRVNSIFSSLQSMENSYKESAKQFDDEKDDSKDGKEFAVPSRPKFDTKKNLMKRRHGKPDHVLHPEKYTKYSLRFDGTSEVVGKNRLSGDQLNKKIAMDFLDTLQKQRKDDNEPGCEGDDSDQKIVYKAPGRATDQSTSSTSSTTQFQSSHGSKALVMNTFEFGAKKAATKKDTTEERTKKNETKEELENNKSNHLPLNFDFDDIEEKDDDLTTSSEEKKITPIFKARKKNKGSYRRKRDDNSLPETIDEEEE